ncbi:glycoside hydrolase family 3 C-terminal domain-containing protein [Sphingorhabdus sp. Alg231-15]|uniref:glycoside hydrolase family 3 C-terminal domain-containing protein n=1 Tax=Sphingorhabdus sp. Alg231-15 TaxID=1922222 RepID=UPI000D5558F6
MKKLISSIALGLALAGCQISDSADVVSNADFPFQDQSLSIEERVDDLISRMTLGEKAAQMYDKAPAIERLGVPAYVYWNEALHGVARAGEATVFPQAIGMAATFDEELMLRIATTISDEGRAKHHDFLKRGNASIYTGLTFWSPNINIFRDPRWGRGQETYGEDPYLTGRMAVNFVNGLQGDDPKYLKTVATVKHYAVHSGPETTRHTDDYNPTDKDLYETYLPAFATAIADANPASAMCVYNAVRGIPGCASEFLMQDILREELGFSGFVVSDCGAIGNIHRPQHHDFVKTKAEAAAISVKAGTELVCGDGEGSVYAALPEAVEKGLIDEMTIDRALKRIFTARFKLGMFDNPDEISFASIPMDVVGSEKHLALTKEAARKSLVLLKNNGILPLKADRKIAVIGPNADNFDVLIGNYHGKPVRPVTALEGLKARFGNGNVAYAPGSSLGGSMFTHYQPVPAAVLSHRDGDGFAPGIKASYYKGEEVQGEPAREAVEKTIDFEWKGSPATDEIDEAFTAVWEGYISPASTSRYRFGPDLKVEIDGKEVATDGVKLTKGERHAIKVSLSMAPVWHNNVIEPMARLEWLDLDRDLTAEAMAAADKSDVILFFSGLSAKLEGEEMSVDVPGFVGGDRTSLDLPAEQLALLKKLQATGKPIVLVNFSGSAVNLSWADKNLPAVVQGFYPGEATGLAVTELLLGDYSPAGRLPVTFYKDLGGMLPLNDYSMKNRTYKYFTGTPVYPFGHGLSYTRFAYSNLVVPETHDPSKPLTLSVTLTNKGEMDSDEVVQVYASRRNGEADAPLRTLVKFDRVIVPAGGSRIVSFTIAPNKLRFVDSDGSRKAYQGTIEYSIGSGQPGSVAPGANITKKVRFSGS